MARSTHWRPVGLALVAAAVFIGGVVSFALVSEIVQTRARLSVTVNDQAYRTWISSDRNGYHCHVRGPNHSSLDGLIVSHEELAGAPVDCSIEWLPDERQLVFRVADRHAKTRLPL